jgi:hypothetical protein
MHAGAAIEGGTRSSFVCFLSFFTVYFFFIGRRQPPFRLFKSLTAGCFTFSLCHFSYFSYLQLFIFSAAFPLQSIPLRPWRKIIFYIFLRRTCKISFL